VPKFVFTLQALKEFRANRLLMAKKELHLLDDRILQMNSDMLALAESQSLLVGRSIEGIENIREALGASELAGTERRRSERIATDLVQVEEERERNKRWVTELGRELKIVEKLEEKQKATFEAAEKLREKRGMDRWVAEHWGRHGSLAIDPGEGKT